MNSKRNFLVLVVCFFLLNTISVNSLSDDARLLALGFPQEYIDLMSSKRKIEILSYDNIKYLGSTSEDVLIHDPVQDFYQNDIVPLGLISASTMTMSIYSFAVFDNSTYALNEIEYTTVATWNYRPAWTQNDYVAYNWDNSNLRYKDNSFKVEVKHATKNTLLWSTNVLASATVGAFSGKAKLSPSYASKIITNFALVPVNTIYGGSNQLFFNYAHQLLPDNIVVTLPTGFGGSISFGGSCDTAAITQTILISYYPY